MLYPLQFAQAHIQPQNWSVIKILRQFGILNGERIAKAIEHMIVDAMLAAEPYLKIASHINDPKRYLALTDDIKTEIQRSQAPVSTHILQVLTGSDDNVSL
jgi:hypothetical protein